MLNVVNTAIWYIYNVYFHIYQTHESFILYKYIKVEKSNSWEFSPQEKHFLFLFSFLVFIGNDEC